MFLLLSARLVDIWTRASELIDINRVASIFPAFFVSTSINLNAASKPVPDASMTDLTSVLPGFPTHQYVRLLPKLEKNLVTTADLLTLDCVEVAKRAQLPLLDVKRLCNAVLEALQGNLGISEAEKEGQASSTLRKSGKDVVNSWNTVSTLNDDLDSALGGGIPAGYITEVTGER